MTAGVGLPPRFRGQPASNRSQQFAGAMVVLALALAGIGAITLSLPAIAFFTVGAGAGYSLSGSV